MPSRSDGPKVLLFDIGGVCVVSPFQAILDYEVESNIPPGWVNHAISRSAPNGAWQKLERGEIKLDAKFFEAFYQDLHNKGLWQSYLTKSHGGEADPSGTEGASTSVPPLPEIDAEWLFWEMMRISRTPDPWMYPALKKLKASCKFILGALSNTIIFPPDHPYSHGAHDDVRSIFDVFVSSAHVGLRKPDPRIYHLAVAELDKHARGRADDLRIQQGGISAGDVLFLDDIGENLKAAKTAGMRTLKVHLGKGDIAVRELENITGMKLSDPTSSKPSL
ncbi:MAG: hypothetical protein M1837_005060 [Sclerophora amabilis]|nr:MAG: hypothetical protein M1837_005060 [Sclerophora amabilis]